MESLPEKPEAIIPMETESNEIATTLKPPEEPEAIVPMETASSLRKKKSKHKRERDRKKQGAMNTVECIQSKKACFRAAIHSEEKSTLHQEEKLQLTIHSALSGGTPTNYSIYRLSALLSLALLQPTVMWALLYPAILHLTLRSASSVDIPTDSLPFYSACRYCN
jgi:hypothetical protein